MCKTVQDSVKPYLQGTVFRISKTQVKRVVTVSGYIHHYGPSLLVAMHNDIENTSIATVSNVLISLLIYSPNVWEIKLHSRLEVFVNLFYLALKTKLEVQLLLNFICYEVY